MSDEPRMSVVPAGVIEDVHAKLMTPGELLVLMALGTFTNRKGWTYPTRQERLAERCRMTREHVSRTLMKLEWLGWVERRRAARTDRPQEYRVRLDIDDSRAPGTPPKLAYKDWREAQKEGGDALKTANAAIAEIEAENGGVQGHENKASKGDTPPPCDPTITGGLCDPTITRPCDHCDHTPCDHCDHNSNDDSYDKPPTPLEGSRPPPAGPGDRGAGPDGLDPAAFRQLVRDSLDRDTVRARFNVLIVEDGQLIAPNEFIAAALWRDFSGLLQRAGVTRIRSQSNGKDITP